MARLEIKGTIPFAHSENRKKSTVCTFWPKCEATLLVSFRDKAIPQFTAKKIFIQYPS